MKIVTTFVDIFIYRKQKMKMPLLCILYLDIRSCIIPRLFVRLGDFMSRHGPSASVLMTAFDVFNGCLCVVF